MIAWGQCFLSACALGVVLTPVSPSLAHVTRSSVLGSRSARPRRAHARSAS